MIRSFENISLKGRHTFGIDVKARYLFEYDSVSDLREILKNPLCHEGELLLMGAGSNLLFLSDYHGVILHSCISGIEVTEQHDDYVIIKVGAGVEWDSLVEWCVDRGFGGIENLSLIPGDAGAAPVQNIGAYGVEFKDVFHACEAISTDDGSQLHFSWEDCEFAYRDSVFKNRLKNKVIVTWVYLKLSRMPSYTMEYGNLKDAVASLGGPSLRNIRQAVISIRQSKLPDPVQFGNAGSFFKNPVVDTKQLETIRVQYSNVPYYNTVEPGKVKIPAGWLIDKLGWKGKSLGNAGVHKDQALVLINLGGATGSEVKKLASQISADVRQKFNIDLEPEVNMIG